MLFFIVFFFSSRRRHTSSLCDWSSDVCSSDLEPGLRPTTDEATVREWWTRWPRSEERRVGKSVDLGGRRIIKKKKKKKNRKEEQKKKTKKKKKKKTTQKKNK